MVVVVVVAGGGGDDDDGGVAFHTPPKNSHMEAETCPIFFFGWGVVYID